MTTVVVDFVSVIYEQVASIIRDKAEYVRARPENSHAA
jgi:hypothetical protein